MLKVQEIREIIRLIDESSINEFTYETNGTKIKMKKDSSDIVQTTEKVAKVPEVPKESIEAVASENKEKPVHTAEKKTEIEKEESAVDYDHEIVSPMVGTFYQAPSPDSNPYVQINSEVKEDTVVCIVEAMKLFNEIEAEVNGTIVDILVEDGELVEYGQPLFRVKKK